MVRENSCFDLDGLTPESPRGLKDETVFSLDGGSSLKSVTFP